MLRGDAVSAVANISQHHTCIAPFKMNEDEDFIPDFSFLDEDIAENLEEFDSSFNFNDISLLNCSSESLLDLMCCTDISDPCLLDSDDSHDMPSLLAKTSNTIDTTVLKEDFNRVLDEWQSHLSGMDRQHLGLDTDDFLLPEDLEFLIGSPSSEDEPAPVSEEPEKPVDREDTTKRQAEVVQRVVDCDSEEDEEIDVVSVDEAAVNPFRSMQIVPVDIILGNGKNSKPTLKMKTTQDTKNTLETKKKVPPLVIKKEHKPPPGVLQPRLVSLLSKTNQKTTPRPKKSILITCPSPIVKKNKQPKLSCSSNPMVTVPSVPIKPLGEDCIKDHDYCAASTQKQTAVPPSSHPPTTEEANITESFNKIPDYLCEKPKVEREVVAQIEEDVFVPSNDELYNKLPPYMTGLTIAAPQVEVTVGDTEQPKDKPCPTVREFKEADWKSTSVSKLFERRYRSSASPASSCSSPSRSRSTSHDREGSCSRSGSPSSNGSSCNGDSRSRIDSRKHRRSKHESPSSWDGGGKRSRTNNIKIMEEEKLQQIDDRRIIYVGNIDRSITRTDLRRRFDRFGPIEEINIYHRHTGNYGFITFEYRVDAVDAIEHGNDNPNLPRYDLNFGGRRQFCRSDYKDLDSSSRNSWARKKTTYNANSLDFDSLLQATKSLLKAKKKPT